MGCQAAERVPFYETEHLCRNVLPELGETTSGKGGAFACLSPLPLLGFLHQSPTFLLPHLPWGTGRLSCILTMLHRTVLNRVWRMKSWKPSQADVSPKERGGCGKESARENKGSSTQGLCTGCASRFFFRACRVDEGILAYCKEGLWAMGENLQADCVQSQKAFPACCCPRGGERISSLLRSLPS